MKKNKTTEERVYEILGVKIFKKIALALGKKDHDYNDVKKHDNYYLYEWSTEGLERFKDDGLEFNTIIHACSSLAPIAVLMAIHSPIIISISLLCILINGYSLMLQRYNYIRLNRTIELLKKRDKVIESQRDGSHLLDEKEKKLLQAYNHYASYHNTETNNDEPSLQSRIQYCKSTRNQVIKGQSVEESTQRKINHELHMKKDKNC